MLSCDNIEANGQAARTALVSYARLRDADLADWIAAEVAFPSSMVDRITPVTTSVAREFVKDAFDVADRWPVMTESFCQWIVEDRFGEARPPLDAVGVRFVADVHPYEVMKTRLLNASHSALGYLGYLAGLRTTDEALAQPALREYLVRLMDEEISPLLPEVPGVDPDAYTRTLVERSANPRIAVEIRDVLAGTPNARAIAGGAEPDPLLEMRDLFDGLVEDDDFVAGLYRALRSIDRLGPLETVEAYGRAEAPGSA